VSQVGKAEPSDFVTACDSVNEDDWEFGEIVKYAYENLRGDPKIECAMGVNVVGAIS
jgi:hypothetical protein